MQQNAGVSLAHLNEQIGRQRRRAAEWHKPNRYASDKRGASSLHVGLCLIHLPQNDPRMTIDRSPRLRHRYALLTADEEFLLEMIFQRRKLLAERRLSDMQNIGGARYAACINDDDERLETFGIHLGAADRSFRACYKTLTYWQRT